MGKKKDKDKEKAEFDARMFRAGRLTKKQKAAVDRYGIDLSEYHPNADMTDRVSGKKGYDQLEKELLRRANADYTTMRANEAAALAGNEEAKRFAEKGIGSLADLTAMGKMQKKMHRDLGKGGAFTSASDFAGLSFANVEADRQKLMEDLQAKAEDATPELPEPSQEPQFLITAEEDLARDTARDERIADYEKNRALTGLIGDEDTQKYLDDYKFNVASGLSNAGISTRGPNAPQFIL
jgi:hypothetical protein